MQEGDLTHEEINAAVARAEKTIIFARQNRLRDGVLLDDDKLHRFHAGHDNVKFFYSAVRQLPEYFLDALLARDISVTLVVGQGMVCFRDARNWCAVHAGRTRRTIYLPEKILEVAFRNGYDYWSIAHILVTQGWKLLDYALLQEMVEAVRQRARERSTTVVGHSTFRDLLRRRNRHRSSYESPELREQRRRAGMESAPINELEEFAALYEPRFARVLSRLLAGDARGVSAARALGLDRQEMATLLALQEEGAEALSSDAVAKLLFDEYHEELWAQRKSAELFDELGFPDFFLLDRDILHPAAREMAEALGQDPAPQTMAEARHDYRDHMRFGIGTSFGLERLLEQAPRFGADGILGLMEEVVSPLFERGELDQRLAEAARGVSRNASKPSEYYIYLARGLDLVRLRDALVFWQAVKTGQRTLRLEDVDTVKRVAAALAVTKAADPLRAQLIGSIDGVGELFDSFRGLIAGEAHRLLDEALEADDRVQTTTERRAVFDHLMAKLDAPEADGPSPKVSVWQLLEEQLETAVVRATLCLDLSPDYGRTVAGLVARGEVARRVVEDCVRDGAGEEMQIVVQAARSALGQGEGEASSAMLAEMKGRVDRILEQLPRRFHPCTSATVTPLRRALRELEKLRRRHPTDPEQLGYLAMVLVRLDRLDNYGELLEQIRWMGRYAVGRALWPRGRRPYITPGLLKVVDDANREGPEAGAIQQTAGELAQEITGEPLDRLMKPVRTA